MKLEDQVTSFDISIRLKEIGVKQESLNFWRSHNCEIIHSYCEDDFKFKYDSSYPYELWNEDDWDYHREEYCSGNQANNVIYSAFTVSELGSILFEKNYDNLENMGYLNINTEMIDSHKGYYFRITNNLTDHIIDEFKESDSRAKMLIYLIENGLIKNYRS